MQITSFLDKKLSRRFLTYDLDSDGYLGRRDFEWAAERIADEFGLKPDDANRRQLFDLCIGLREHLLGATDTDADGRINEAEYKTAFAAGLLETPESFDAGYVPFLETIVAIADGDADGRLTADDYVRWTGSLMNVPEDVARGIHRRLDADGDGYVDTTDLLAAIRAYYFDDDPGSAGSWLLGPLD
jgi:Ca2+-binding EF-hand superfamily protein